MFQVQVVTASGNAVGLRIEEDKGRLDWAEAAQGAYLLRTNCLEADPRTLWRWYIQLTDGEDAFRVGKSDLGLSPVHHHREDRVQTHILVRFLAVAMWRCLEMWLLSRGLGDCGRQVLEQLATIHSRDVVLPVKGDADVRFRLVAKPERLTADLLSRMQLILPSRPKAIQNVAEKA